MVNDAERTLSMRITTLDITLIPVEVQSLLTGFLVAGVAHMSASEADIESNIAAETTLIVDVFVAMKAFGACALTEAKLVRDAFRTSQIFL